MPTIASVKQAYSHGGATAVVRGGRRRLAGAIYPGQIPQRPPARPSRPPSLAQRVKYADALAWFEQRKATYERLAEACAPYVDPQGVMLDVGANIGYFTKTLAEAVGFTGDVHLFEPLPHLARLCRETVAEMPARAQVHEFGLSDQEAVVDLYLAADGNLGWNTLVAEAAKASAHEMVPVQIRVHRFDQTGIKAHPSFVKIDVEGAEHRVLAGMMPAIRAWSPRPVILCEIGWGRSHPEWRRELPVLRRLVKLGYRPVDLDGRPVAIGALTKTTDVLFLPTHSESLGPAGSTEPAG